MAEMDETRRAELYEELQQYMYDNVFQIPMFVKMVTYGVWDYIDGFVADPASRSASPTSPSRPPKCLPHDGALLYSINV